MKNKNKLIKATAFVLVITALQFLFVFAEDVKAGNVNLNSTGFESLSFATEGYAADADGDWDFAEASCNAGSGCPHIDGNENGDAVTRIGGLDIRGYTSVGMQVHIAGDGSQDAGENVCFDYALDGLTWDSGANAGRCDGGDYNDTTGYFVKTINITDTSTGVNFTWRFRATGTMGAAEDMWIDDFSAFGVDAKAPGWTQAKTNFTYAYTNLKTVAVMRGEVINISARWSDNIALNSSWLMTNETGQNSNFTGANQANNYRNISGTGPTLVNWTWINTTGWPRAINWTIFADDIVSNRNGTNVGVAGIAATGNFTLWGWSNITWISPAYDPVPSFSIGDVVQLEVNVSDANLTWQYPISGMNVTFYRKTQTSSYAFIGSNMSDSSGRALLRWGTSR